MKQETVVLERTLNAPRLKVWRAITDTEEMRRWYFDIREFKPVPGFEFQFSAGPEGKKYLHLCKVIEAVPERTLKYSWRYEGHQGISEVTFDLLEEVERTRLKLTHTGLETFPSYLPEFGRESFLKGWTSILDDSLRAFVESGSVQ